MCRIRFFFEQLSLRRYFSDDDGDSDDAKAIAFVVDHAMLALSSGRTLGEEERAREKRNDGSTCHKKLTIQSVESNQCSTSCGKRESFFLRSSS